MLSYHEQVVRTVQHGWLATSSSHNITYQLSGRYTDHHNERTFIASNDRTVARTDSKQKFTYDFSVAEKKATLLDKNSVEFYVWLTKEFIGKRDKTGVSMRKFTDTWQEQFPYRSVSTIRQNLLYAVKCVDAGYDLSSFETVEHFRQPFGQTQVERKGKDKKSGNGTAFDAVLKPALSLSAANKKKLIAELMASL